ncbi:nuclear transport factor 2 family protein [Thauera sp.]|jgi:ketosteroid isomerase-like protein|uniref:nuclear transport factor 2 family protein n=1 Tax=Thauera sp. TaxID=1905334 RepID=UPI00262EE4FD|nr:nuclear transport factor 2 family protein [Thauera sp.]MCK6408790.1 nuclear transport factor 2 family protein [Thauera sp.]
MTDRDLEQRAPANAAPLPERSRTGPHPPQTPAQRLARFYEALAPANLAALDALYAPGARFKDPFNEVTGTAAIRRIFAHMFATTDAPRFVVTDCIEQGEQAMLGWEFHFVLRGRALIVRGVTHLRFDADGRVVLHRDYWDAAEELYEQLPLLGGVMRLIKRRLSASLERP